MKLIFKKNMVSKPEKQTLVPLWARFLGAMRKKIEFNLIGAKK